MLNKELLLAGITGKEPHILIAVKEWRDLNPPYFSYGYSTYDDIGKISRIPCWGGFGSIKNYTALKTLVMKNGEVPETIIKWRNPYTHNRLVVTRLDTGKSVEFEHTSPSVSELRTNALFFTREDIYKEVPLIFDPPPTIIWIPVRTNRSKKRVLCRRRSLGGSRC